MNPDLSSLQRLACLLVIAALPGSPRLRATEVPTQADAFPDFESYIKVSGQAPWISGDGAAFAQRTGAPATGAAGIEDLYYTKDLTNDTTVILQGHALGGSDDFLTSINLTTDKEGSVDAGYKRFRTFYDGVGGFFPLADQFQALSSQNLHVDRSTFWIEAKLAKPDQPVFTLSFHDEIRTGMKDSSEWAAIVNPEAAVVNGALIGTALPTNTPFVAPNVLLLDEHHDTLEAAMVATIGRTTETFRATSDWVDNNDARDYVKFPNSTVTTDPAVTVDDDQESRKTTTFRVLNQTETKLSDQVAVETGLVYSHAASENSGNWITPAYSATANAVFAADTAGAIYGGATVNNTVGNIFLKLTPNPNWLADLGFREESNLVTSQGGFQTTALSANATTVIAANVTTANNVTYSHESDHVATPELSMQYLGIARLALYGTVDDQINRGYQHWVNPYAASTISGSGVLTPGTAPPTSVFYQQANEDHHDAKIGANWNATSRFNFRAEIFRKDHQNELVGANAIVGTASYGGLFVNGYTFTGVTLSLTYKPVPQFSFATLYQPQSGNMSVTANAVNGGIGSESTSGKARAQQVSETANWTPSGAIYVQANVNVVYSYLQTAYPIVVVSSASNIATPIQNANNNYVTGSTLCGFVVNKATDGQLQGTWQKAGNYNPQIAAGGQPYGASFEEISVTAGLKHKFSEQLMADAKVGYLRRTDPTTGGFTNYRGPLAYVAFTYSL